MLRFKSMLKLSVAQTQSSSDIDGNLAVMKLFCEKAKAENSKAIFFPEMAYLTGSSLENRRSAERYQELSGMFSQWAREYQLFVSPGSLRSVSKGGKAFNHLVVFGPDGKLIAEYKKIFLFKANLPDRRYDESEMYDAGKELVVFEMGGLKVGLSICFDLRFPEMFRSLRRRGADVILVPSAFTVPTGEAHWEVLLRARAIENQCFVVAPSLTGESGDGSKKYGHSLVVDPWGEVLFDLGDSVGLRTIDIDVKRIESARKKVDTWSSLRTDLFPIA